MFDLPTLPALVLWSVVPSLIGFALIKWFGADVLSWLTFWWMNLLGGYGVFFYLNILFERYKSNLGNTPTKPTYRNEPKTFPNLDEQGVYPQTTGRLKLDAARHCAVLLLRKYEYDPEQVDLTETYWLRNEPRKWLGKDEEFRELKHSWEGTILERKDPKRKNSEYVLRSAEALHYFAAHGQLPH